MKNVYDNVASAGGDVHYRFSKVALADRTGRVVRRERLDHQDRAALRTRCGSASSRHWETCRTFTSSCMSLQVPPPLLRGSRTRGPHG